MDARDIIDRARAEGRAFLDEARAKRIVKAFGIRVPTGVVVETSEQVGEAVPRLAYPVAAKLLSPDLLHKSDIGAVMLGLSDEPAVRAAYAALRRIAADRNLRFQGVLLEEMAPAGVELVIGGIVDRRFGPVVMLGLGGVFIEVFHDVAFRICPLDRIDAAAMIDELRAAPILRGARGRSPVSREAIIDALIAVGGADGLMLQLQDSIAELDINPLMVSANAAVACDACIVLSATRPGAVPTAVPAPAAPDALAPLFSPRSVVVAGASATTVTLGNEFIRHSRALGFSGRLVPLHPSATEIEGLPCRRSFAEVDEIVDYAYIAIAAARVPDLLGEAAGKLKFAQVISSGFGEVAEGKELEARLQRVARSSGIRLLGPNCLGVHSPRGGITFVGNALAELGSVGIVSQSGGLAVDMILRGQQRNLRFSGIVTLGNSVDLSPAELVEFYLADTHTRVIGLYLEDARDGRRLFEALRRNAGARPVVLLIGGQTQQGQRAATSHTGSLATELGVWSGLAQQAGAIVTDTLDEFLNALLAFQTLTPRDETPTEKVVLFGNGGGTSVLATDAFARQGFSLPEIPPVAQQALAALNLPPGTSIANPIDTPAATLRQEDGRVAERILETIFTLAQTDAVVMHINLPVFLTASSPQHDVVPKLVDAALRTRARHPGRAHFVLVLRSDGSALSEERKRIYSAAAVERGIPVFDEMTEAARALAGVAEIERYRAARRL